MLRIQTRRQNRKARGPRNTRNTRKCSIFPRIPRISRFESFSQARMARIWVYAFALNSPTPVWYAEFQITPIGYETTSGFANPLPGRHCSHRVRHPSPNRAGEPDGGSKHRFALGQKYGNQLIRLSRVPFD